MKKDTYILLPNKNIRIYEMSNTTIPIHKLFRVYETLDQFDAEASHPENKICFIKDKRIIYANGVEYTNEQMYDDNITDNIKDAAKFKTVYNALLDELKNRNYMELSKDGENI